MESVVPSTSVGSVITAPAEMKNSGVVKSTTAAFSPKVMLKPPGTVGGVSGMAPSLWYNLTVGVLPLTAPIMARSSAPSPS